MTERDVIGLFYARLPGMSACAARAPQGGDPRPVRASMTAAAGAVGSGRGGSAGALRIERTAGRRLRTGGASSELSSESFPGGAAAAESPRRLPEPERPWRPQRGGAWRGRTVEAFKAGPEARFFMHVLDVSQMRHAAVTASSCGIRARRDFGLQHVFLRRFWGWRLLRTKKARGAEASRARTTFGRGMLALAMTAGLTLGRPFQYSPSEAPDVDARLTGSNEPEGGIDPIRILGTSY